MENVGGKSKVVVIPCEDYDRERVYLAMKQGIDMLGGIGEFVKTDERILVKPNYLAPADAGKAITTHPSVICAMLRILRENGYSSVTYGDSPGHGSSEAASRRLHIIDEARELGAVPADMETEVRVDFSEGMTAKEFHLAKGAYDADAVISLCKMKTHALERITGAVKNIYGLICGYRKAAGHVKYPNAGVFARMLADMHRYIKPRLHIMDGVIAMEGNGPASGEPVKMNVLLFSRDPVALDTVFCKMVNLDPELVPTNVHGQAMGIGTYQMENIEVLVPDRDGSLSENELMERFGNPQFRVDRKGPQKTLLGRYSSIMTGLARRPVIDRKKCVRCGICVSHCPVPGKAVDFKRGKDHPPVYDYKKCIRCYCCQEMCPENAISVKGRKVSGGKGE